MLIWKGCLTLIYVFVIILANIGPIWKILKGSYQLGLSNGRMWSTSGPYRTLDGPLFWWCSSETDMNRLGAGRPKTGQNLPHFSLIAHWFGGSKIESPVCLTLGLVLVFFYLKLEGTFWCTLQIEPLILTTTHQTGLWPWPQSKVNDNKKVQTCFSHCFALTVDLQPWPTQPD